MKITIEKTVTEKTEVEITLPCYRKDNICHVYKVFSEDECIQVCYASIYPTVGVTSITLAFGKSNTDCTKDEFETKMKEIVNLIINK